MYIFSAREIHCSIIELIHITLSKAHITVKKNRRRIEIEPENLS